MLTQLYLQQDTMMSDDLESVRQYQKSHANFLKAIIAIAD